MNDSECGGPCSFLLPDTDAMIDLAQQSTGGRKQNRSITLPASLVPHFEAAIRRRDVPAGVSFNDDGTRTYHVDADAWDEAAVVAAAEEGVEELRATLAARNT